MTLPFAEAKLIGLYSGIGFLASFLMEIPSGYFSDRFGHKLTLILAKILMFFSTIFFIIGNNFWYFVLGAICLSVSFAFQSGAGSALMHNTLSELKRDKEYSKIMGKLGGNVSLISAFLIIALPFFTKINILLPLKINLVFDIIGLVFVILLVSPKEKKEVSKKHKSIMRILKEAKQQKFFSIAIFTGAIGGFMVGETIFRSVYLESLGYPIIFIGFVMGLSRVFWFLFGHIVHKIEEHFTMKQHFFIEIFLFPMYYILVASFYNPYVVGLIFSIFTGYKHARTQVINSYLLNDYIKDERYKATLLSVRSQVEFMFNFIVAFSIGYVMNYSYKLGYGVLGVVLFVILSWSYLFIRKH